MFYSGLYPGIGLTPARANMTAAPAGAPALSGQTGCCSSTSSRPTRYWIRTTGSFNYLGRNATGPSALRAVPGGREPRPLRDAAAGAGHRPQRRPPHRDARRLLGLGLDELKRMGVVLKRAQYFITCGAFPGRTRAGAARTRSYPPHRPQRLQRQRAEQLSMFAPPPLTSWWSRACGRPWMIAGGGGAMSGEEH